MRVLEELAEIGMQLARAVRDEALEAPTERAAELALTFSRVARAVRQTVALEARLARDAETQAQDAADRRERRAAGERFDLVRRRKAQVRDVVERAIESDAADSDREHLLDDLYERLEDDLYDADFAEQPVGELIARICKDLGVAVDPGLWADEAWGLPPPRPSAHPAKAGTQAFFLRPAFGGLPARNAPQAENCAGELRHAAPQH